VPAFCLPARVPACGFIARPPNAAMRSGARARPAPGRAIAPASRAASRLAVRGQTAAINLAVEAVAAGLEVVVIDLDPQVSACDWKDIRGERAPLVAATPVPHLDRTLKAAADNGADLVIIDTAGRTSEAASAAARAADLILVPLQPSLIDLKTLGSTLDIIRLAGSRPARALLTRVKPAGNRHEDTTAWLAGQGIEVCPTGRARDVSGRLCAGFRRE
jgi:cellulose biosynthesis protein BcsQ